MTQRIPPNPWGVDPAAMPPATPGQPSFAGGPYSPPPPPGQYPGQYPPPPPGQYPGQYPPPPPGQYPPGLGPRPRSFGTRNERIAIATFGVLIALVVAATAILVVVQPFAGSGGATPGATQAVAAVSSPSGATTAPGQSLPTGLPTSAPSVTVPVGVSPTPASATPTHAIATTPPPAVVPTAPPVTAPPTPVPTPVPTAAPTAPPPPPPASVVISPKTLSCGQAYTMTITLPGSMTSDYGISYEYDYASPVTEAVSDEFHQLGDGSWLYTFPGHGWSCNSGRGSDMGSIATGTGQHSFEIYSEGDATPLATATYTVGS
jgi:hypothetical protein